MAERRSAIVVEDDDVRERLNALTTLMFLYDPRDPETTAKARRLNAHLKPVRDCARAALATEPRDGPATAQARAALVRCWGLVDEAAMIVDRSDWFLRPGDTTVKWAQRHVEASLRALAEHERHRGERFSSRGT